MQSLEGAGWDIVEEVIDARTYVVARDPNRSVWAIGVASTDADRRGYIEWDIGYDTRVFDRVAFVEPLEPVVRRAHGCARGRMTKAKGLGPGRNNHPVAQCPAMSPGRPTVPATPR